MPRSIRRILVLTLVALGACAQAQAQTISQFVYPTDGAANVDLTQHFSWTSVASAEKYYLYVGTAVGLKDLVDTGEITATSWPACGAPVGQISYARIYTKLAGAWSHADITFTPSVSQACTATLTTPGNGAANADLGTGFSWSSVPNATAYTLHIGTSLGASNVLNTGEITQTSRDGCDMPPAQTLYARMWTKVGYWRYVDSSFTTAVCVVRP
jgi:hypothetical protein